MDIILVSSSCSSAKYSEICSKRNHKVIDPQQKFFRLIAEGFAKNPNTSIRVLSILPVSASSYSQKIFHHEIEFENGVEYEYLPFINGRLSRYLTLFFSSLFYMFKWAYMHRKSSQSYVIADPLVLISSMPCRFVSQLFGLHTSAIITDVPTLATNMKKNDRGLIRRFNNVYQKISDHDSYKYDSYITLTDSINERMNPHNKPFVVVEGVADVADETVESEHSNYIMYAGGVYEMYGVKSLVDAFIKLNSSEYELHIYGNGSYVPEIESLNKIYPNICYKGCLTPEEIVQMEKKAKLLVNPRPIGEDFSKYSFPSKTMEYMLSGTPVISTRLPGIPKDYFEHMYYFEKDSCDGIYETLKEVLSKSDDELRDKGLDAHDYIIKEKNNVIMTSKIISLFNSI